MTKSELIAALTKFALTDNYNGYDWGALFDDGDSDKTFNDYTKAELNALYNDYLNYINGV